MRALTVAPGRHHSLDVHDVPDPDPREGELLVDGIAVGVCGTDREIADGDYGWSPPGRDRLIIGHESLGRVRTAPDGSGFSAGDLVVGVVRRPDPLPCGACAHGQFDMCRNGQYTERGIKQIDGYASQAWSVEPQYAVKLDPRLSQVGVLMEPTTVVAKAWEQVERVGARAWFEPKTVLVTGAGPIGLLAAMLGVQRGLDVHVLDRVTDGPKPALIRDLGATYHHENVDEVVDKTQPDVVIEATGVGQLVFDAMAGLAAYGIICLTGVSPTGRRLTVDAGSLNRELVLANDVVVGSVNANLSHYAAAADALARQAPVREALRRLAHEGLVLQLPRRGSFVAEVSTEEARDAYEVRAALELLAVRGALENLDDAVLTDLDQHVETMVATAAKDDLAAFIDADVHFHQAIWTASGNLMLPRVWLMVEASMRNLTLVSNRLYFENLTEIARTHYPLVSGLRARDPAVAVQFHDHVLEVWSLLYADARTAPQPS